MSTEGQNFPLGAIREHFWPKVKNAVKDGKLDFIDDVEALDTNRLTFQSWLSMEVDEIIPDTYNVTVLIEQYPCSIEGCDGRCSFQFDINNIKNCSITQNDIVLNQKSPSFNGISDEFLATFLAEKWSQ